MSPPGPENQEFSESPGAFLKNRRVFKLVNTNKNMKRLMLFCLIFSILICGILVSADIPTVPDPTHRDISVVNNITNINTMYFQAYSSLHAPLSGMGREYFLKLNYNFSFNKNSDIK